MATSPLEDPPTISVPEPATNPPRRKLRFSFSLLTFLLVISLILAVISHVRTSRLLENYREQSDELEIESPQRIHVRRMKLTNHVVWRWRVFLPEGQFFCLRTATKGVTGDKLPAAETGRLFDAYGEVIVDVFARDTLTGSYDVTIMSDYANGGSVTTVAAQMKLNGHYLLAYEELAKDRTQSFAIGEPVVLLRGSNASTLQSPADPASEPGIIVWIEAVPPPSSAPPSAAPPSAGPNIRLGIPGSGFGDPSSRL